MNFAGFPPTIVQGSTSETTTLPAATTAPSPTLRPGMTIARPAIQAFDPMDIGA